MSPGPAGVLGLVGALVVLGVGAWLAFRRRPDGWASSAAAESAAMPARAKRLARAVLPDAVYQRLRTAQLVRSFPRRVVEATYGGIRLRMSLEDPLAGEWYRARLARAEGGRRAARAGHGHRARAAASSTSGRTKGLLGRDDALAPRRRAGGDRGGRTGPPQRRGLPPQPRPERRQQRRSRYGPPSATRTAMCRSARVFCGPIAPRGRMHAGARRHDRRARPPPRRPRRGPARRRGRGAARARGRSRDDRARHALRGRAPRWLRARGAGRLACRGPRRVRGLPPPRLSGRGPHRVAHAECPDHRQRRLRGPP